MAARYLHKIPRIREGLDHFLRHDPVFKTQKIDLDTFTWKSRGAGFPELVRIIIGQQVSTAAARTMVARFEEAHPEYEVKRILKAKDADLRALGLSGQKVSYIRGLSEAVHRGTFQPHLFSKLDDDEVHAQITALKGLGPWSAHMFLMFGLARPDIWAPGDLGIQEGLRRYHNLKKRPDPKKVEKMSGAFAPHRTAASLLLWNMLK